MNTRSPAGTAGRGQAMKRALPPAKVDAMERVLHIPTGSHNQAELAARFGGGTARDKALRPGWLAGYQQAVAVAQRSDHGLLTQAVADMLPDVLATLSRRQLERGE